MIGLKLWHCYWKCNFGRDIFLFVAIFTYIWYFFSVICIFISLRIPFTVMTFCSFVKGVPREIDAGRITNVNLFYSS